MCDRHLFAFQAGLAASLECTHAPFCSQRTPAQLSASVARSAAPHAHPCGATACSNHGCVFFRAGCLSWGSHWTVTTMAVMTDPDSRPMASLLGLTACLPPHSTLHHTCGHVKPSSSKGYKTCKHHVTLTCYFVHLHATVTSCVDCWKAMSEIVASCVHSRCPETATLQASHYSPMPRQGPQMAPIV